MPAAPLPLSSRSAGPVLVRWVAAASLLIFGGCTVDRIVWETGQVLQWTRLTDRTDLPLSGRWQLPRHTRIDVREQNPAPRADWLTAAQAGVDSVFPPSPVANGEMVLLVNWPQDHPQPSRWPHQLAPMPLQVALYRHADGALVESAEMVATAHWFSGDGDSPALVERAFRDLASLYRSTY